MAFNKETDWLGVDLDSTLAYYEAGDYTRKGPYNFGEPIEPMAVKVRGWIADGITVKIVTARHTGGIVPDHDRHLQTAISKWTLKHLGKALEVQNSKDGYMHALYDDRAVAVESNTGRILSPERSLH